MSPKTIRGPTAVVQPTAESPPPSPTETGRYFLKGIVDVRRRQEPIPKKRGVGDIDSNSRLPPDFLNAFRAPDTRLAGYIKTVIGSFPKPQSEDDRMSLRVKDSLGLPADKARISESMVHARNFAQSATFAGELGGERLEAILLYCGKGLDRLFLLTNAPLPRLGEIEPEFYNQLTASRSIKLSARGKRDLYIMLAPLGIVKTLEKICRDNPPKGEGQGLALEAHSGSSPSGTDLPAVMQRPSEDPYGFSVRKEDEESKMVNTLGIKPEQLRGMKVDKASQARLRELLGKEDFKGFEVVLAQPGVEGMRLIMTPRHPASLVGSRMEGDECRTSEVGIIDFTRYMEAKDRRGRKMYYIRMLGDAASYSSSLDNTAQILHENGETMLSAEPSAQEAQDKLREERHDAVREYIANFGRPKAGDESENGRWEPPKDECVFGEHIAIIFSCGKRHYLITDGKWDEARKHMEANLYAYGEEVRLVETSADSRQKPTHVISGFAQRSTHLSNGEEVTIMLKPVGKRGMAAHTDTLEMIPRKVLEAAGAIEVEPPEESPEERRRCEFTIDLLRRCHIYLPESLLLEDDDVIDEKTRMLQALPGLVSSVEPDQNKWYLILRTSEGKEYSLFRFPCGPEGLNQELVGMPAATLFTNPADRALSYVLIENKFLNDALTDLLLGNWRAP